MTSFKQFWVGNPEMNETYPRRERLAWWVEDQWDEFVEANIDLFKAVTAYLQTAIVHIGCVIMLASIGVWYLMDLLLPR